MPTMKKRIRLTFEVTPETYEYFTKVVQPGIRGKFLKAILNDVMKALQSSKTPYKLIGGIVTHSISLEDLIGDLDEVYDVEQEHKRDDEHGEDCPPARAQGQPVPEEAPQEGEEG